jgi:hypothetical protein
MSEHLLSRAHATGCPVVTAGAALAECDTEPDVTS